ncbi:tail-specific protease [Oxalobacteraceae bacterium OM1]|nr:tail-specific protease [Oxalobacteraceae bacterium OM1]
MKKTLLGLLLASVMAAQAANPPAASPPVLSPQQQQGKAAHLAAEILTRYHYKAVPLDEAMSRKVFAAYLKALDPDKLFFLQSDIDQFADAQTKLGDAIFREDLRVPFDIFNAYEQRVVERLGQAREMLKQDFDFSKNESYQFDRSKEPWAKSSDELAEVWRKRIKNEWLRLKLSGKDDKAIRETLDKRYATILRSAYKYNSEDVFQTFMNAYTNAVDPHTDYFGPKSTEDFNIAMKLSLFGIGAVLQEKDEYTTIRELTPGGPASTSGKLNVGDRITAVGQGKDGAMTDVVGWRLDEVVQLIRGAKGSVVRLDVLPGEAGPDAKHKQIQLVRDKITLEQQAARKSMIQFKDGAVTRKIGVISLPSFYLDFDSRRRGDKDFKSASRDVARLLDELKKDKADGVLVDLRNNGGGSLDEAVDLAALFIGKSPVVQERTSQGKVKVEVPATAKRAWDGPMGVLINRGSASASEIFAAAIQDYGRGVVIGEPSFGKGTVQTILNLDQMVNNDKAKFGELKMTVAQFFRVNGGTTQLRGVTPDIGFPAISDLSKFGESAYDNALPWTSIKPADYAPMGEMGGLLQTLKNKHASRIAEDRNFQYLLEDIAALEAQRKKQVISLNEAERRKEHDAEEARRKARRATVTAKGEEAAKNSDTNSADLLAEDDPDDDTAPAPTTAQTDKNKKPKRDVWLNEAAHIVSDAIDLLKRNPNLAARTPEHALPSASRDRTGQE